MSNDEAKVILPRKDIFHTPPVIGTSIINQGACFHVFEKVEYPDSGGIFVYYRGLPFPKKGFPYPEALHAMDIVKRIIVVFVKTLSMRELLLPMIAFAILPWKKKIRIANRFVTEFNRPIDWLMRGHELNRDRLTPCADELHNFIKVFLSELGISETASEDSARQVSMLFEYDDSYRYRLEDITYETSWSALYANPRKEFVRLAGIFEKREHADSVKPTFKAFKRLVSIALMIPKIKRAFTNAIRSIDFERMKLDEADSYHCLLRPDYDFGGKILDERMDIFRLYHPDGKYPPMVEIKSTEQI